MTCKATKKQMLWFSACIGAVLIGVILSQHIAIGFGGNRAGSCLSFALDKRKIEDVDRIVLRVGKTDVVVSDQELIEQLKRELLVATQTDLRVYHPSYGKYIDFYKGEELVRSMRWEGGYGDAVEVYEEDAKHIIWFSADEKGLVFLSKEVAERLNSMVEEIEKQH